MTVIYDNTDIFISGSNYRSTVRNGNRLKKSSVSLIAIFLIVILMVLPTGYEDAVIYQGTDKVKAKVVYTDESTVKSSGLIQSGEQFCQVEILGGKFKRTDNQSSKYAQRLSGV